MITVALANRYKELPARGDFKWCYIGKTTQFRESAGRALGKDRRFLLKRRLHKIAEELRTPFLDYVAGIGILQKDRLRWWAGRLASKNPGHTDVFQLFCYRRLLDDMVEEFGTGKENMVVIVDDIWLYREVKEAYSDADGVRFLGNGSLFKSKAYCVLRGSGYRVLFLAWIAAAKMLVYWYHGGKRPDALKDSKKPVAILSYAETKAFKGGKYSDRYLGDIFKLFEGRGVPYFCLWYLMAPLSTAKYLRRNSGVLWPLVLDVRMADVLRRVFAVWNASLPSRNFVSGGKGLSVGHLTDREKWHDYSDTGFVTRLLFFDALRVFFGKKWCRCVLYVFENQAFEKILCMAAAAAGVRLIGYQHSSIGRLYLSQFLGEGEARFMPLPDTLLTTGEHSARLYGEGGMPEEKISVGGALRYRHMLRRDEGASRERQKGGRPAVVVALPVYIPVAKSLLNAVFKAFSGQDDKVDLVVKPHPDVPFEVLGIGDAPLKFSVSNQPLNELFDAIDVVITSMSTSSIEAYLYGKKVVSFIPENLIVYDSVMDIEAESILKWYEGEALSMDFIRKTDYRRPTVDEARRYFGGINDGVWLDAVLGCHDEK